MADTYYVESKINKEPKERNMSNLRVNQLRALDGDAAFKSLTGTARVRYVPGSGELLLQISEPNADGTTYSVGTFIVNGGLRDVMQSDTEWPTYPARSSFHDVQNTTDIDAARELAGQGEVPGGDGVPISAGSNKAGS